MDQKDLKQIREVFKEEFRKGFQEEFTKGFKGEFKEAFPRAFRIGFEELWKGNLEPALNELAEGQEQIKLRLDNAAWRFEFVELDKRVKVLEEKAGIERTRPKI